jgi:hypothetical protein
VALPAAKLRDRTQAEIEAEELLRTAHRRAVEDSAAEIASYLQKLLGQKWTAYMAGISDPKAVGKWARGERTPRGESERRMRQAFHAAFLIESYDDAETARVWFMGMNPFLNHRAPAWVIANDPDGGERTLDAAIAFLAYG